MIAVKKLTNTAAELVISGVDVSIVNALRRSLIAEVPKMALEEVEFHLGSLTDDKGRDYESVSPLFDEIIAHRLSMVPIPTDLSLFNFRDACSCGGKGCTNCSILYVLNKQGPSTVYSEDLKPVGGDKKLEVVDKKIPIVKLGEGEGLLLYATAILGRGRDHAKWQPAHAVGYKNYPKVDIDSKKCNQCGKCVKVCKREVFGKEDKKVIVKAPVECNLCKACEEVCEPNAIEVAEDKDKFVFKFETDGALSAKNSLEEALSILRSKTKEFERRITKL